MSALVGEGLLPQATDPGVKGYRRDTHRLVDPVETLARVGPLAAAMGITRLANVTGLDTIGIPVVMAVRPRSRSLAVSQGKGLTLAAAEASALMESVEAYHAERVAAPLRLATYAELRGTERVVDVERLPRVATSTWHPHAKLLWVEGHDLVADAPTWVPYELVHTDYTLPQPAGSGCFPASSNGLASGNHLLEATSHALSEVIERDATTLWVHGGEAAAGRRVRLDTVDDPGCRQILDAYARADVMVAVWELTSDVGVPAFLATIAPAADDERDLFATAGKGAHPRREVALLRALTEAAQSRLTLISGSRDDHSTQRYRHFLAPDSRRQERERLTAVPMRVDLTDVPSFDGDTFAADVTWLVERLGAVGIDQVVVVDLTLPQFGIPVVRAVVPGLEGIHDAPGYTPGARALARHRMTGVPA